MEHSYIVATAGGTTSQVCDDEASQSQRQNLKSLENLGDRPHPTSSDFDTQTHTGERNCLYNASSFSWWFLCAAFRENINYYWSGRNFGLSMFRMKYTVMRLECRKRSSPYLRLCVMVQCENMEIMQMDELVAKECLVEPWAGRIIAFCRTTTHQDTHFYHQGRVCHILRPVLIGL